MEIFQSKLFKICLFAILLFIISYQLDYTIINENIKNFHYRVLTITTALMFLTIIMYALRWWLVLKSLKINLKLSKIISLYLASLFTNIAIPGSLGGEALKIWQLNTHGIQYSTALNSILLDRMGAILATAAVVSIFIVYYFASYTVGTDIIYLLVLSAIGLAISFFLIWTLHKNNIIKPLSKLINKLLADTKLLLTNRTNFSLVLALSILGNCIHSLIFYYLTIELSVDISLYYCLALIPIINVICYLPISYAGWGIREAAVIYGYSLVGIPKEIALMVSIIFGLQLFIGSLFGGFGILRLNKNIAATVN
jgi:uncharacterized protein (TIRG00374 family)